MSALRGSRNAADFSTAIAPSQSSATTAFLPAANSGVELSPVGIRHRDRHGTDRPLFERGFGVCSLLRPAGPQPYRGLPQRGTDCVSGNARNQHAEDSRHRHRTDHSRLPILAMTRQCPAAPSHAISLRTAILSLPRQERLGLPYLLPLGIRVLGEVYQLAKILR